MRAAYLKTSSMLSTENKPLLNSARYLASVIPPKSEGMNSISISLMIVTWMVRFMLHHLPPPVPACKPPAVASVPPTLPLPVHSARGALHGQPSRLHHSTRTSDFAEIHSLRLAECRGTRCARSAQTLCRSSVWQSQSHPHSS